MINTPPRRQCLQARFVKRRNPTAITVEGPSTPPDSTVGLIVEYATTVDMDDGRPLPPFDDDCAVWRVIRRMPGARTRWRRIRLSTGPSGHATDRRLVARDYVSGRRISACEAKLKQREE
jgi:hypothetical protein